MQNSIAFFTEMGFNGKVSRTHENMRTEFAWMCALNADHYNYRQQPSQQYDLGIIIISPFLKVELNSMTKSYLQILVLSQQLNHLFCSDVQYKKQIWKIDRNLIFYL